MNKPVAESCLRNQEAILDILSQYLRGKSASVLELGSGTGQHGVYIAQRLPDITWQPSDLGHQLSGIQAWVNDSALTNIESPLLIDVTQEPEVVGIHGCYDVVFTANTVHFVPMKTALSLLFLASTALAVGGLFFVYGAFNRSGNYVSEGNRQLDKWLKSRDPDSGLKDLEWLEIESQRCYMKRVALHGMPANNFLLVFQKIKTR